MHTITLSINGMSCGHCVARVRRVLEAVPGTTVRDVRVGSAEVALEEGTAPSTVISAVQDAGYDAVAGAGAAPDAAAPASGCCGARATQLTSLRAR